MPHARFAFIFVAALIAAALTIWLLSLGGPTFILAALPAFLLAALALRTLRQ
ncbi:MAG: hypothetical protein P8N14_03685 [Sulfitobacter sp.]|jgi:hypothetical protein|nr:hypothetical protein [Sulfitobacter sp.]